jgi:hypothetical protein
MPYELAVAVNWLFGPIILQKKGPGKKPGPFAFVTA